MGLSAFKVLTLKNKIEIFKYSLGSRLVNSVPKGLQHTYDFLNWLESKSINFHSKQNLIQFDYPIQDKNYTFCIEESSSDSDVFTQIIVEKEYESVIDIIRTNKISIKTIVDAGANVGYTGIYLSHYYPEANILALEPNQETYQRLNHNIEINRLKNIESLQNGLWNKKCFLKPDYSFRDKQSWSFRLEETSNENEKLFEATSIQIILENKKWKDIDFLKVDIEGGEKEVFDPNTDLDWLNNIKIIAIEIHDEFNCRKDIEQLLKKYNFELSYSGELTIGVNRNITPFIN